MSVGFGTSSEIPLDLVYSYIYSVVYLQKKVTSSEAWLCIIHSIVYANMNYTLAGLHVFKK